jgi:hypothetical protein
MIPQMCQSCVLNHFDSEACERLHDTRAQVALAGEPQARSVFCDVLRVATIGYNVSIEKPVVVRHDLLSGSLGQYMIDDCHNWH